MPLARALIHLSYLLYLCKFSRAGAWAYWRLAMRLCSLRGLAPSLLLHPLDFLGGDDESDLDFFPAMELSGADKRAFVREVLSDFSSRFHVLPLGEFADTIATDPSLKSRSARDAAPADRRTRTTKPLASNTADIAEVVGR